jgi:opacity protein-like surface antigen
MKKILLAAAALISATAVQAESSSFAGFYAGVHGGVNQLNGKLDINAAAATPQNVDLGKASGFFGIHAGYNMLASSNVVLGLEAYLGLTNAKSKSQAGTTAATQVSIELKKKNFYGVAARLGYLFNSSTMIYGRLALEGGKVEAKVTPTQTATMNAKASKNSIRPVLGAGLEFAVASNVLLGAEYNYVVGSKFTATDTQAGTANTSYKFNTSEHRFGVRLSYKF